MKFKHTLLSVFIIVFSVTGMMAQGPTCEERFTPFYEMTLSKNYDDAEKVLFDLRKSCPKYNTEMYMLGKELYEYKIEAARTPEVKQKNIDELVKLYAEQERNFPNTGGAVNRALLLYENKLADEDEVYKILDAAATLHPEVFTSYKAIETYFNLFVKRYKDDKNKISKLEFIEKYSNMAGQIALAKKTLRNRKNELEEKKENEPLEYGEKKFLQGVTLSLRALDAVKDNMQAQASEYFSCDALETYYKTDYDKNKGNTAWLAGLVSTMYNSKCYTAQILQNAAKELYKSEPDAETLLILADISLRNNMQEDGIGYYQQAADAEQNTKEKGELYARIAGVYRNIDKAKAKEFIEKAIQANPDSGKNYLFLSELYSTVSKECNLNAFQQKAIYWLAIDAAEKAAMAEPRYKATAEAFIKRYKDKLPAKDDLKASDYKKGDVVTFGCWINESVTIPKL